MILFLGMFALFQFYSLSINNFYSIPFLIYYSSKMLNHSPSELRKCLIHSPVSKNAIKNTHEYLLAYGLHKTKITIDGDLNLIIGEFCDTEVYKFKPGSMIFPLFNEKRVHSVQIHEIESSTIITLSPINKSNEQQEQIQRLYSKLVRVFTHKGFNEFYRPIKRLGRGSFATVYLVQHRYTFVRRAAKVFSMEGQKIQYKGKQALQNQIETLRNIDHPNLIKYDGLYQTESLVYLVTEYLSGGTLDDTLKTKTIHTGQLIQNVIRDILSGLAYLDSKHIMHRDIKPENIILREEDNKWVIGDFGLAAKSNEEYIYDKCGTMGYIAPEIMALNQNEKYAQACDTYSLGVIAYQLVVGQLPFKVQAQNLFDKKIVWVLFDRPECKQIHPSILSFLQQLLQKDPSKRITPKQALNSPFFKDQQVVNQLISFHERRRAKRYERILQMANCN